MYNILYIYYKYCEFDFISFIYVQRTHDTSQVAAGDMSEADSTI